MYFWKIEKLKRSLAKNPLSQSDAFKYLVYLFLLYSIISFETGGSTYTPFISNWILKSTALIAYFLEILGSYKFNGGRHGNDFLGRYLPITVLTRLRLQIYWFLIFFILTIVFGGWEFSASDDFVNDFFEAKPLMEHMFLYTTLVFTRVIIPLRVMFHMKDIRRNEVNSGENR